MVAVSEVLCRVVSVVILVDVSARVVSGTDADGVVVVAATLDVTRVVVVISAGVKVTVVLSVPWSSRVVSGAIVELSSAVDILVVSTSSVVDISSGTIVVLADSVDNADAV